MNQCFYHADTGKCSKCIALSSSCMQVSVIQQTSGCPLAEHAIFASFVATNVSIPQKKQAFGTHDASTQALKALTLDACNL